MKHAKLKKHQSVTFTARTTVNHKTENEKVLFVNKISLALEARSNNIVINTYEYAFRYVGFQKGMRLYYPILRLVTTKRTWESVAKGNHHKRNLRREAIL